MTLTTDTMTEHSPASTLAGKADFIEGIMPVLYAFFDDQGKLRQDGFVHQVNHCLDSGATGVVLFGYVTQFYRLSLAEKIESLRTTVAAVGGRGHVGVTVMEPTLEGQQALIQAARDEGASWIILQPPLGPPSRPVDWLEMLATQIPQAGLPVAIQNASMANTQLSNEQLFALQQQCPDLVGVKAETDSVSVAAFAEEHHERFRIITGNWGVEYPFFLRHGAQGLIPAPNFVPEQVALHRAAVEGDWERVETIHSAILPLMEFIREREAPEGQLLLGKLAYGWRTGCDTGRNRQPGPQKADRRLVEHARRLWDRLAAANE